MSPNTARYGELTAGRVRAFSELFGAKPQTVFPSSEFSSDPDEGLLIDVLVFPLEQEGAVAAVTNGLSNRRMVDAGDPESWARRELIADFHGVG
jgi:hypothetical protein